MRAPAPSSSLRDRIKAEMEEILGPLKPERIREVDEELADTRPDVISAIRQIAEFEPRSPAVLRDQYSTITTLAKRLRAAVQGTEFKDVSELLDRIARDSSTRADAISVRRSGSDQASMQRKLLAARRAYELLMGHGSRPTLTAGRSYITLANLFLKAATGSEADAARACARQFRDQNLYNPRRPRTRLSAEFKKLRLQRFSVEARRWQELKPLDELLDELLR